MNASPFQTQAGTSITSLSALMQNADPLAQLLDIAVQSPTTLSGQSPNAGVFSAGRFDTMRYAVESLSSLGLTDLMPWRSGKQIQVSIDVSAAGIPTRGGANGTVGMNAARKFVSAATLQAYATAGVPLVGLDGAAVTAPGWYDFTARDLNNDGVFDTDGAIFVDFQQPGQPGFGFVDAIVMVLTDNTFGDDDPTLERVVDPILPGASNAAPSIATATTGYVNSPVFDAFAVRTGMLAAADTNGDSLTYGLVGGVVRNGISTVTNGLGSLQVDVRTGRWTFVPNVVALNQVAGSGVSTFATTVSDGLLTTTSAFTVSVTPSSAVVVTGSFRIGSGTPGAAGNVVTNLGVLAPGSQRPVVAGRQHYIEFTLQGVQGGLTLSDLRLSANDRLLSLRRAQLVKVAEGGGSVTYRLLGLSHVTSARARYTFAVTGAAGWIGAAWDRR